jgi:hypothetical protein
MTFNTGTSEGLVADGDPNGGYTKDQAALSDQYYGDGLAFRAVVEDAVSFFAGVAPEVAFFQEIFYSGDCALIPAEARAGFVCETWTEGDPTVAQLVAGQGYQVACNWGKSDKCAAVKRSFGAFRGCGNDFCLEGLAGSTLEGCGQGARIGRGVIELAQGGTLTIVNVHSSSGFTEEDMACRVRQVEQVFVDLGGGVLPDLPEPAANGPLNLIMGDFNTDPGRMAEGDPSAKRWNDFVGEGLPFAFVSPIGPDAPPSYAGVLNIDHAVSDRLFGSCWTAGLTAGHPAVTTITHFDHKPLVCELQEVEQ